MPGMTLDRTKRINVGDKFKRQDFPNLAALQPSDYTAYPLGAKKIGLICQDGLAKRKQDAEVYKDSIAVSSTLGAKGISSPVAVNSAKPLPNVGILSAVDKFFNWINGVLK